ncbi:hypothetical protein Dfer_3745 [Dyadobacter fermentans DSM 18053]|uniref:Uncharacterized protein n=2 Tax=Dyadobacter fermentans TaxID=94254 RepID=C6VWB8_DYAFD|nr:hypothetical protein Dfer_3745 [Dyadobacter fermentans DSM 18053]
MQVIVWISMAAMLIVSQYLLTTSTGKLLEVKNVMLLWKFCPDYTSNPSLLTLSIRTRQG